MLSERVRKVLLIDADVGGFPNLALMKLSRQHKEQGDEVFMGSCVDPDIVHVSCAFTWNRERAISATKYYPNADVHFGGSGFNLSTTLPDHIEHLKPDYSIYPKVDFSLGFTTRGCVRRCPWCVVPEKEGTIRAHSPLSEFVEPKFNKIILLDNNLLTYPGHMGILRQLVELDKKTCFNQGLDIRYVNEENAEALSLIRYYDLKFGERRLYFAWDDPATLSEEEVKAGIRKLNDAGVPPDHLMFYVLVGFNTGYTEDLHRVKTLIDWGVKPYVMLYDNRKGTYHHHLKRWIERRYYEVVPWEKYDHGDSQLQIKEVDIPRVKVK